MMSATGCGEVLLLLSLLLKLTMTPAAMCTRTYAVSVVIVGVGVGVEIRHGSCDYTAMVYVTYMKAVVVVAVIAVKINLDYYAAMFTIAKGRVVVVMKEPQLLLPHRGWGGGGVAC